MHNVYMAGHMLTRGAQLQRTAEKDDLIKTNPSLRFYNPLENKEINDKANLDNNSGLAERIVKQDTDAILWSDVVVIEPLPEACGTMVELGQIKGMRDVSKQTLRILESPDHSVEEKLSILASEALRNVNRRVYPHYEDIRRFAGVTESEDRRSLGINQYVYGVCLDVSEGHGFYEWDEIVDELSPTGKV